MSVFKRGKTWWVRFTFNGVEYRKSAKTTVKSQALEYEQFLLGELKRQYRGGKPRYDYNTAMLRFLNDKLTNIKSTSAKRYMCSAKQLQPYFETLYLDEINKKTIMQYVTIRRKEVTDATIRRDLACLSAMLSYAVDLEMVEHNVVKDLDKKPIKAYKPRTRYLSKAEFERLIKHSSPLLRRAIIFAVETGLRLSEQFSAERSQVDFNRREMFIPKTKTDSPRVVALSDLAMAQIKTQVTHLHSKYLFCKKDGSPIGSLKKSFATACRRARVSDCRWHDLRRTCGAWLLQSGVPMHVVSKFLGHSSVSVTERSYAFLQTRQLHEAVSTRTKYDTGEAHSKDFDEASND